MSAAERAFVLRRSFGWGILIVSDPLTTAWPELGDGIVGNEAGVVIPVRHAQDVDVRDDLPAEALVPPAEVEVECFVNGLAHDEEVAYDGHLVLSEGRVLLGDADACYELRVAPGRWRVQVALDVPQFSEHVRIWFTAAT
jgi:hypothetical protein